MLEYEEFLLQSFPTAFGNHFEKVEATTPCSIDKAKKKAANYLNNQCNAGFGYFGEAHTDRDVSKSDSVYMIPTSYDSGLLLPYIMNEGISSFTKDALVSVLRRSERTSGFWNFFFDPDNKPLSLFPDDIDDSSVPLMALYVTGNISLEKCKATAEKMLKNAMIDSETGAIATWLLDNKRTIIFDRYLVTPKLCVGCLINFLWFLASIGMDKKPEVLASIDFVEKFVEKLEENKRSDELMLPEMCYYTNKYVIYLFMSRFVDKSEYAQKKIGQKFIGLLIFELNMIVEKKNCEALDIACIMLAVTHLQLHKIGKQNWITDSYEVNEIKRKLKRLCDVLLMLQNKDGSFRAWVVYRWNRLGHWGGSKPYTTGLALAALGIMKREIYDLVDYNVEPIYDRAS